jgi:hypothetical protein
LNKIQVRSGPTSVPLARDFSSFIGKTSEPAKNRHLTRRFRKKFRRCEMKRQLLAHLVVS